MDLHTVPSKSARDGDAKRARKMTKEDNVIKRSEKESLEKDMVMMEGKGKESMRNECFRLGYGVAIYRRFVET